MLTTVRTGLIIGLVILIVAGLGLAYFMEYRFLTPDYLASRMAAYGQWAPVVIIVLMVVHSFVPFPAELLAACAGALFGTLSGSVIIWVGAMLGALLSFWLSRTLGRSFVQSRLSDKQSKALDRWTEYKGVLALLVSRMIPVIAFNLINYAAGLTRVRLWTFIWTTGLGILPITILSAFLGAQMRTMTWQMILVVSVGGIVCVFGLHTLARRQNWI